MHAISVLLFVALPCCLPILIFFFFNDTATTEIYTLSLHDALPIYEGGSNTDWNPVWTSKTGRFDGGWTVEMAIPLKSRSEEHTSELQSQSNLVCRLLLEKKKNKQMPSTIIPNNVHRRITQRSRASA